MRGAHPASKESLENLMVQYIIHDRRLAAVGKTACVSVYTLLCGRMYSVRSGKSFGANLLTVREKNDMIRI